MFGFDFRQGQLPRQASEKRQGTKSRADRLVDDRCQTQRRGQADPQDQHYSGGHPAFREHCDAVAADGYRKLALA